MILVIIVIVYVKKKSIQKKKLNEEQEYEIIDTEGSICGHPTEGSYGKLKYFKPHDSQYKKGNQSEDDGEQNIRETENTERYGGSANNWEEKQFNDRMDVWKDPEETNV